MRIGGDDLGYLFSKVRWDVPDDVMVEDVPGLVIGGPDVVWGGGCGVLVLDFDGINNKTLIIIRILVDKVNLLHEACYFLFNFL